MKYSSETHQKLKLHSKKWIKTGTTTIHTWVLLILKIWQRFKIFLQT